MFSNNSWDFHRQLLHNLKHLSVIKYFRVFDSIPSTHLYARDNHAKLKHGTALIALEQSRGVGQGKNFWISPKGGLYLTMVLKPSGGFSRAFPFIAMVSLSIIECFTRENANCVLKWPNDVYYENKKIGGVLASGLSTGSHTKTLILSAGVNLNASPTIESGPVKSAIAFREITGKETSLLEFTTCILANFDYFYLEGDNEDLYRKYNSLLAFKDKDVDINTGSSTILGKVLQVDKKGITVEIRGKKEIIDFV
ncbi:MAG: biotin--[acetyl-CoA-carboxylase] ligase [Candidatus Odinarchaeota archaeon]